MFEFIKNMTSFGAGPRSFTIVRAKRAGKNLSVKKEGRYMSTTPSGAAGKMNTQLCRQHNIKGAATVYVTLRETTAGSKKNMYSYRVQRSALAEPRQLKGRTIKFAVKVTSNPGVQYSAGSGSSGKSSSGSKSSRSGSKSSSRKSSSGSKSSSSGSKSSSRKSSSFGWMW